MSRPASEPRRLIERALRSGVTGTYEVLAAVAGVEPAQARSILYELRRAGNTRHLVRQHAAGRPGRRRAVHAAPEVDSSCDGLALIRQAWR